MNIPFAVAGALRHAREVQERSLADVASTLSVPEEFLADLEAGDFEAFGQELHALAHVRLYARALGLDIETLLADPESLLPTPAEDGDLTEETGSRERSEEAPAAAAQEQGSLSPEAVPTEGAATSEAPDGGSNADAQSASEAAEGGESAEGPAVDEPDPAQAAHVAAPGDDDGAEAADGPDEPCDEARAEVPAPPEPVVASTEAEPRQQPSWSVSMTSAGHGEPEKGDAPAKRERAKRSKPRRRRRWRRVVVVLLLFVLGFALGAVAFILDLPLLSIDVELPDLIAVPSGDVGAEATEPEAVPSPEPSPETDTPVDATVDAETGSSGPEPAVGLEPADAHDAHESNVR